jgi:hypothetical protein
MTVPAFSPEQIAWMQQNGMVPQAQRPVVAPPASFQQPFVAQQQPAAQQQPWAPMGSPQQQPANQQQQQQSVLNQRITAGPGVPAAFVGRTVQEVVEATTRLAGQLQQVQRGQPTPQSPAGQPQQGQPVQQQPGFQQQQQPVQTPAGMTMEGIQQAIRQTIAEQNLPSVILQMEQSIAQQVPIYRDQGIRTRVQEIVGQMTPEQQALRNTWDYALSIAVGERTLQQQQAGVPGGFVQPTVPGSAPWTPPGQQQQAQAPRPFTDQSLQLPQQSFVEAPSNNSFATMQGQRPPINQMEAGVAEKFGFDPAEVAKFNTANFSGFAQ